MAFALPFYLAIGWWTWKRSARRPSAMMFAAAAGLGLLSYYLSSYLNFMGLRYVSAQLERLILYAYPTMVMLLAWAFRGEKATPRHLIALALAYGGILVLFGAELSHQGPHVALGAGLILAGAFLYAIYVTASKSVITRMGSGLFTSFAMGSASLAFLAQSGVEAMLSPPAPVGVEGALLCLALAIVATVLPSFLISEAIGRIGPGPTSAVGGVGPVVAAWAAVAILHEPFGWPHFLAMALTLGGVWLLARGAPTETMRPRRPIG